MYYLGSKNEVEGGTTAVKLGYPTLTKKWIIKVLL